MLSQDEDFAQTLAEIHLNRTASFTVVENITEDACEVIQRYMRS